MTDEEILKLLGLSKDSPVSEMIVQPVHKCFALQEKVEELEAQIEGMKCDVLSIVKDRMNDDIDQNIIERLAEKWEIKENEL